MLRSLVEKLFIVSDKEDIKERYSIKSIKNFVEEKVDIILNSSIDEIGMSTEEIQNLDERKQIFIEELSLCGLADLAAKQYIKSWIADVITQEYGVNKSNIDYAINFDFPNIFDKFCIVLYRYTQKYGFDAMKHLIRDNKMNTLKEVNGQSIFCITESEIEKVYLDTMLLGKLNFEEKLEILVQRIYMSPHGLSVIDDILDQNIEGITLGASGVPIEFISKVNDMKARGINKEYKFSYQSVHLYFGAKEIHIPFLDFGSQEEFERVCKRIYKYKNQEQLTADKGYIFNNMADFSRVTVFRPPYSEGWMAFIRKIGDVDINNLLKSKNAYYVIELMKYQMKGRQNICFTGEQGAGKTTMMLADLVSMYGFVPIRLWENYWEAFLRFKVEEGRDILTIRETEKIKGKEGQNSLKKTNGGILAITEAANDDDICYVCKGALAAFDAVYWTHHANNPDSLYKSHIDAVRDRGHINDEMVAEDKVLDTLKFNVHLGVDPQSEFRWVERNTEYVRLDTEEFIQDPDEKGFYKNATKFYEKKTNAKRYKTVNLIEYNKERDTYILKNKMSQDSINKIYNKLINEDKEKFLKFIEEFNMIVERGGE